MVIGSSPYVFNVSTLSRGQHNITFSVIIDGEVRGLATETFTVLEGIRYISFQHHTRCNCMMYCRLEVFIEFKDLTYSVVEDVRIYNVTIVKQGEPGEDIVLLIVPNTDPTSSDSAECKRMSLIDSRMLLFIH